MDVHELLAELFGRVDEHVVAILDGLDVDALLAEPEPGSNPIGWLVWHLSRVTDMHTAELLDEPQLWEKGDWAGRFGLEPDPSNVGYGHTAAQVLEVRPESAAALQDYYDAVAERLRGVLVATTPAGLDEIVDRRWDPPVTMGVRLVSIADDSVQHAGQAAYLKGLLARR